MWDLVKQGPNLSYLQRGTSYINGPVLSIRGDNDSGQVSLSFASGETKEIPFSDFQDKQGTQNAAAFAKFCVENEYIFTGGAGGSNGSKTGYFIDYNLSKFTVGSPLALTAGTPVKLEFGLNANPSDLNFRTPGKDIPAGVDFWDDTNNKVSNLTLGEGYFITIGFTFDVSQTSRFVEVYGRMVDDSFGAFDIFRDLGSAGRTTVGNKAYKTKFFYAGSESVVANGVELFFNTDAANASVYDLGIIIAKK